MSWSIKKIEKIILIAVFIIFAGLFFRAGQYWVTFLTLSLILVGWRIRNVSRFSITTKGIDVELSTIRKEVERTLRSEKSIDEKVKASQKLIDEAFCAGYQVAGGKIIVTINNVKMWGNENGDKNVQYDQF